MTKQNAPQKKQDTFTRNLVIVMVVIVLAALFSKGIVDFVNKKPKSTAMPVWAAAETGYAVTLNSELTGVPTLDIYEDFQCPICKDFEGVNINYINSLVTEKKAKVNYHILSFIGDESVRAANASACANDEGKFLEFHAGMYSNQPQAENSKEWSDDRIIEIAKIAGLSGKTFESCVKDQKYVTWVEKVAEAGSKANVNSTPTVFVNGKEINRNTDYFDANKFKAAVEG